MGSGISNFAVGKWMHWGLFLAIGLGAAGFASGQKSMATVNAPFEGIDWKLHRISEKILRIDAELDARDIARTYALANPINYPGIRLLGEKVLEELASRNRPLDFQALVGRNPTFWRAEREMSVLDPSFPYFTATLAILSGERATALRLLAISQASLPLTPVLRRIYARPEALMLQLERAYRQGILMRGEVFTAENYEEKKAVLEARLSRWPHSMGLWQSLVKLEVVKAKAESRKLNDLGILNRQIYQRMGISGAEARKAKDYDFIMGSALEHTVMEWMDKKVIAQRWEQWVWSGDPAEADEIARSVALYEKHGRLDLAWLFWRHQMALNLLSDRQDWEHWKLWSQELLGLKEDEELQRVTADNPFAGTASIPVEFSSSSEAWSGDQGVHPLIVVRTERRLATLDARLRLLRPGTRSAGIQHVLRAGVLFDIGSAEGMKRELAVAKTILKEDEVGIELMEVNLAVLQGDYTKAREVFPRLLKSKRNEPGRKDYASILYISGDYEAALEQYKEMILTRPNDGYIPVMADMAARRLGHRSLEPLRDARSRLHEGDWVVQGIRYALGEIDEEELLKEAKKGSYYDVIQQQCEAWFWVSQIRLAAGETEAGVQALRQCLSTGFTPFIEYKIAQAELKRLETAQEKDDPREKPKRNSRDAIAA